VRVPAIGLGLCALSLACASAPAPTEPARVSVEVLRGFSAGYDEPRADRAPVVVLLDATPSMRVVTRERVSRYAAAQRAATRFAVALPATQPLWLYALGADNAVECQSVLRGTRAESSADRSALLAQIDRVKPQGEGALAGALDGIRQDLWRAQDLFGSRIVVFSDFGSECGGDVCASAAKLVEAGARLDFVAIGEAQVPACLREPAGLSENAPPPIPPTPPVHFRLEVSEPEPMVVGCSDAGGLPVAVPPGAATVVVDLDPPLRVDAQLDPGARRRLQVLDFPLLDPPTRQWRWVELPAHTASAPADGAGER